MSTQRNITASESVVVAVSLGSNLAHQGSAPKEIVRAAMKSLGALCTKSHSSSLYLSEPIDCPEGAEDFINAAMLLWVQPGTSAHDFLQVLHRLEADSGRTRGSAQNQARSLDLDIISFGNQQLNSPSLILPHPRASSRRFVLMPLAEIQPEMVLPGQSSNVTQLLAELPAEGEVRLLA